LNIESNKPFGTLIMLTMSLVVPTLVHADSSLAPGIVSTNVSRENSSDLSTDQARTTTETTQTTAAPAASTETTNKSPWRIDWSVHWEGWEGLHVSASRKTFLGQEEPGLTNIPVVNLEETRMTARIGGKLALDAAGYVADDRLSGFDPGVEVRRARLYAKGECLLLLPVAYELEIGYVPGSFYIENSYIQFHDVSFLGELKFGQFQPPMSLDNFGSSRDMTFMEAASVVQALAPGVNAGLQLGRPVFRERMTWAVGLFTDSVGRDIGDATQDFGRVIGRVTGLALDDYDPASPNAQKLVHLGISTSLLYAGGSEVRYQSRPESHLAPYVVDTGEISSDGALTLGTEVAWVDGPLCVQGEYLHSWVKGAGRPDLDFSGFYASASWFLTGESRPYDRTQGTFARVIPSHNFSFDGGGWGAWEVAARYSDVNLSSGLARGGRLGMAMAEVNWYLHPNIKWRFNYGFGHLSDRNPSGNFNVFQTRIEVDF
jgi:phosphate-selective porin OprO/OprP